VRTAFLVTFTVGITFTPKRNRNSPVPAVEEVTDACGSYASVGSSLNSSDYSLSELFGQYRIA